MRKIIRVSLRALVVPGFLAVLAAWTGCRKDRFLDDPSARLSFSQDSVLFDTVFTTIGSSTRNFRVRNPHNSRIRISSIFVEGGEASPFFLNVDGSPGRSFSDVEIAPNDSIYIFVQVNVNPNNGNSPLIIGDNIHFVVNGTDQKVALEAWGQDAYYHYPTDAFKFQDGSYFKYSLISRDTMVDTVWKKDKPHVIYGYLVVDEHQKLTIEAGVRVYLNYKSGLWVFQGGQLKVLGQKGNEVIFQGARREKDYADEPGQWDRIWINEGSDDNVIDYAIIKNGFIGVQAELLDGDNFLLKPGKLRITNTVIQNMSLWGLYAVAFRVDGGNNVISNCQEHSLNLTLGGVYNFHHCTFANYWNKEKAREKPAVNLNNYSETQVIPFSYYFGNCIIDGRRENELNVDLKSTDSVQLLYKFSNCWMKTTVNTNDARFFANVKKGTTLSYKNSDNYEFQPTAGETQVTGFNSADAISDMGKYPKDILGTPRRSVAAGGITAGAYELP
jgi:hypothetical protein